MTPNNFIFSKKPAARISRHLAFWLVIFIIVVLGAASVGADVAIPEDYTTRVSVIDVIAGFTMNFAQHARYALRSCLIYSVYCYLLVYVVIPPLLAAQAYRKLAAWTIFITAIAQITILFLDGFSFQIPMHDKLVVLWFAFIGMVNISPPIVCGLFLAIKMVTTWYRKEQEHLELIQANASAELQLLQAQIHPHFLFNTLNNIYSFALSKSTAASDLTARLSSVLHYMVEECNTARVPVDREIKMIEDYIALETVRYGNRLDLQMLIQGHTAGRTMSPFLLIPFVENCFKHGASEVLGRPWINLKVAVDNDLLFELSNGKPDTMTINLDRGIGLSNVRKRLQLLYPQAHQLDFDVQPTQFTVRMRVPLETVTDKS